MFELALYSLKNDMRRVTLFHNFRGPYRQEVTNFLEGIINWFGGLRIKCPRGEGRESVLEVLNVSWSPRPDP